MECISDDFRLVSIVSSVDPLYVLINMALYLSKTLQTNKVLLCGNMQ